MSLSPAETLSIARREVERQKKRFIGLTASVPEPMTINGKFEWVCDVRIGADTSWDVIQNVPIAMLQSGILTDVNVPVLMERNEAGQLTIIGRAEIKLPNVHLITYTHHDLDYLFMLGYTQDGTQWRDAYGYAIADPQTSGVSTEKQWVTTLTPLDEWDLTGTRFWQATSEWRDESDV